MNYYYCSSCDKKIELKYKKTHLKSEFYEKTVIDKYVFMNPELFEKNNIL